VGKVLRHTSVIPAEALPAATPSSQISKKALHLLTAATSVVNIVWARDLEPVLVEQVRLVNATLEMSPTALWICLERTARRHTVLLTSTSAISLVLT
jgi:hypothetical protein